MVEELLPASVALLAEMDANKGIVSWPDRLVDEHYTCLFWSSASLFDIAFCACTDNILPNGLAAHTSRNNMVERQFAGWLALATILTSVFIACENISSIKFHLISRQTVVKQQADNPRHRNIKIDGRYPVVTIRLKSTLELAHLAPALKIIV